MNRVTYIVDGFNIYHSAVDIQKQTGIPVKWLDLKSLLTSYLYLFGDNSKLSEIYYFSALAYHLIKKYPRKVIHHKKYISCLEESGVNVILGRFKPKTIYVKGNPIIRHEEKESDVAMAIKLIEIFIKDSCDTAVIVSGDTDLAPAVRAATRLFPTKKIAFLFPFKRKNKELAKLAQSCKITQKQYLKFQFDNPYITKNNEKISKPSKW